MKTLRSRLTRQVEAMRLSAQPLGGGSSGSSTCSVLKFEYSAYLVKAPSTTPVPSPRVEVTYQDWI